MTHCVRINIFNAKDSQLCLLAIGFRDREQHIEGSCGPPSECATLLDSGEPPANVFAHSHHFPATKYLEELCAWVDYAHIHGQYVNLFWLTLVLITHSEKLYINL